MNEVKKNISIGALVFLSFGLLVWVLLFLHPSFGDGHLVLHVRFPNVDKITVGTKVTYAGRPVGRVIDIKSIQDGRAQVQQDSVEQDGRKVIFPYELVLGIDSHVKVFDSDSIGMGSSGLMGERFIAITPRPSKTGEYRLLKPNDTIYADVAPSVEDTFVGISAVVRKAEGTIDQMSDILSKNQKEIETTVKNVQGVASQLEIMLRHVNDSKLLETLQNSVQSFQKTADTATSMLEGIKKQRVVESLGKASQNVEQLTASLNSDHGVTGIVKKTDTLIDQLTLTSAKISEVLPHLEAALTNLPAVVNNADAASRELKGTMEKISAGQGTLGKLIADDDAYFKSLLVLDKMNLFLQDMNSYGILFHLDKGWQREQRKRIADLEKLKTPTEFSTFLDEELSRISASIARVSMALEKAENTLDQGTWKTNSDAKEDLSRSYKDLLRQIRSLEQALSPYSTSKNATKDAA